MATEPKTKQVRVVTPSAAVKVRLNFLLAESLYDAYAEQAIKKGRTAEDEIANRLVQCQGHSDPAGLYVSDADRAQLEKALGHNISQGNVSWLVDRLKELVTLEVDGIKVELPSKVQTRLKTRVFRGDTLEGVVKREVVRALEEFCGLR